MKKSLLMLLFAAVSMGANAQFEEGTKYVGASLTGLNISYSSGEKFGLGLQGTAGYFFADSWMLTGRLEYTHQWMPAGQRDRNEVVLGAGARYYFQSNGIFLGAGLQYKHAAVNADYLQLPLEVGYCYYLNQHVSIEPAVYFEPCLNKFSDGTRVGLKVGLGFYF
ncbi:MAG: porin family protein [Bacteroidaceae bacterium]|jgi:long-subunit fatty acid transport protein|nr:porin family protein [Bacteroidaceae bacterium]